MASATFPALGDTFESIDAFKARVYKACYLRGVQYGTTTSTTGQHCTLGCATSGWRKCRSHISVKRVAGSFPPQFEIVELKRGHSCSSSARRKAGPTARANIANRLRALGEAVPPLPASSDGPAPPSAEDDDGDSDSSSSEANSADSDAHSDGARTSTAATAPARSPAKRPIQPVSRYGQTGARPASSSDSEHLDDGDSTGETPARQHGPAKRQRAGFPARTVFEEEIAAMLKKGPVPPLAVDQTFAFLNNFLIALYAHSQLESFTMGHRYGYEADKRVSMTCSKSRAVEVKDRCRAKVVVVKKDGEWRVDEVNNSHSTYCQRSRGRPTAALPAARLPEKKEPRHATSPPPSRFVPPILATSFSAQLSSFLLGAFPSSPTASLTLLSTLLTSAGLSSIADLVNFLLLPNEDVVEVVLQVCAASGVSEAEVEGVVGMLDWARGEVGAA
ncbi:hypothetical protein JCM10207_007069 [Rhodosporidiobolus poonsookiae]